MGMDRIDKGSMVLNENELTIFNAQGEIFGKTWILNGIQYRPDPVSLDIEDVINGDIQNGNADKISCVRVDPRTAVVLFLEGKITKNDIGLAIANDELVTFVGVKFNTVNGEMSLSVVVKKDEDWSHSFATLDKDGNVV
jgi:hypothetical protein